MRGFPCVFVSVQYVSYTCLWFYMPKAEDSCLPSMAKQVVRVRLKDLTGFATLHVLQNIKRRPASGPA